MVTLNKSQEAEIHRVKAYYPYRIAYGMIDKPRRCYSGVRCESEQL